MKNLVNNEIKARKVRVVDTEGNQLGVMDTKEALQKASEQDLDLVLMNDQSDPHVCKIADFQKMQYEQKKKDKENKKKQRENRVETKEIQLRPVTEEHDRKTKEKQIQKFLEKGNRVKIVVNFRGREMSSHKTKGVDLINQIIETSQGRVETKPTEQGRSIYAVITK